MNTTNRITREEITVIALFAACCILIGSALGWSARAVSSRDKYLVSTAEKHFSERDYYQQQINHIITAGSKGEH